MLLVFIIILSLDLYKKDDNISIQRPFRYQMLDLSLAQNPITKIIIQQLTIATIESLHHNFIGFCLYKVTVRNMILFFKKSCHTSLTRHIAFNIVSIIVPRAISFFSLFTSFNR